MSRVSERVAPDWPNELGAATMYEARRGYNTTRLQLDVCCSHGYQGPEVGKQKGKKIPEVQVYPPLFT